MKTQDQPPPAHAIEQAVEKAHQEGWYEGRDYERKFGLSKEDYDNLARDAMSWRRWKPVTGPAHASEQGADTKRLDWLETWGNKQNAISWIGMALTTSTLREAIDAAMSQRTNEAGHGDRLASKACLRRFDSCTPRKLK